MRKSSLCLFLAFAVIAGLAIFPPWTDGYGGTHAKIWHAPFNHPPEDAVSPTVDYPRMLTEMAIGECLVLVVYLTLGRRGR
jgi:hypothetical protein